MELEIQLPLDILQRRSLLRRLQTLDPDGDESEMQLWYGWLSCHSLHCFRILTAFLS